MDLVHLQQVVESATSFAAYEPSEPSLWKSLERVATAALMKERALGRCGRFVVRCDGTLNTAGGEEIALEIAFAPPLPRARTIVVRVAHARS